MLHTKKHLHHYHKPTPVFICWYTLKLNTNELLLLAQYKCWSISRSLSVPFGVLLPSHSYVGKHTQSVEFRHYRFGAAMLSPYIATS